MNKIWIQIKIGKSYIDPVLLFDGAKACPANTMPTLSCALGIPQRLEVPIEFFYQEGDSPTNKVIFHDSITLQREPGIINAISKILSANRVNAIKIDIYFNENEDGLCIGFLAPRFLPAKYIVKRELYQNGDKEKTQIEPNAATGNSAKEVFVNNYQKFGELLPITVINKDNGIVQKWENMINSIDNSTPLHSVFEKYKDNLDLWLKLLCSWGLKQDGCKQYPGSLIDVAHYASDDLLAIDQERNYRVIVPCWTIWIEEDGKRIEKLVSKGFVQVI